MPYINDYATYMEKIRNARLCNAFSQHMIVHARTPEKEVKFAHQTQTPQACLISNIK